MQNLLDEEIIDGIKIIRRGHQYLGVQLAGALFLLSHAPEYDLIVDQFHGIPFFTPLLTSRPKLAVVQEYAHEVWLTNPLPWPMNWIIGLIGYLFDPFVFLFYRNVPFMTGSASARNDLVKLGIPKEHIHVIAHGVLIPSLKLKYRKEKLPTVIYLGILSRDKGIEEALKCFKLLSQKSSFQFWVIGSPETKEYGLYLMKLVKSLGMHKKIKFWGGKDLINDKKKFELLGRAHVMVNPSIREGWGLVNIEANAVGTPVVGYNSPGLIDSIKNGESGLICRENTPTALAGKVQDLLGDKEEYADLASTSFKWSKNFNWQKSRSLSLTLINRIVRVGKHEAD